MGTVSTGQHQSQTPPGLNVVAAVIRGQRVSDMKSAFETGSLPNSLSPQYDYHMIKRRNYTSLQESTPRTGLRLPTQQQRQKVTGKNGTNPRQDTHHIAFQEPSSDHAATTLPPPLTDQACSPRFPAFLLERSHRPSKLCLTVSNDFTALPVVDLRQLICDTRSSDRATIVQVPLDRRPPVPPTPTTARIMGNNPSSIPGETVPDGSPQRSGVQRNTKRLSRKGSYNLLKRIENRSPLPRDVTASVMSILNHVPKKDENRHRPDDEDDEEDVNATDPFLDQPEQEKTRYPEFGSQAHSASTITIIEDKTEPPLSASTTIHDWRSTDVSWTEGMSKDESSGCEGQSAPGPHAERLSNLRSPTLPAPSPLPEDSPHKYGLRDTMDTPEDLTKKNEVSMARPRRASSGVELFNEIQSLQTAASFLNGLSSSRRRAGSADDQRHSDTSQTAWTSAKDSTSQQSSARPLSASYTDSVTGRSQRRRGHNFKPSGFAYSRALTFTQISCYRKHTRLLMSKNKHAPVECSVCHIDDNGEHWSCSWCAIRMCNHCRKDFAERGMEALRERIKTAELGGRESAGSSSESLR